MTIAHHFAVNGLALRWRGVLAPHFAPTSMLANTAFWTGRPCPVVCDRIHAE